MARPMRHRWGGRKVAAALTGVILSPAQIQKIMTPLHLAPELLPLGLFTRDHADSVAMIVNLVAMDSAGKGNGMWMVANEVGEILLKMRERVDQGKAWNCTASEREDLIAGILKMDKYMRTWTNRRYTMAAIAVDRINVEAKAKGGKLLDRVEIPA